jgi:hypothetical protein
MDCDPASVEHRATLQLSNRVAFHKIDSAAGRRAAKIKNFVQNLEH